MDTRFIFCPNCGVRNFSDDPVCGVCKTPLSGAKIKTDTQRGSSTNILKILAGVIGVLFIIYVILFDEQESTTTNKTALKESQLRSSPETQLAVINDKTSTPKQITINLFANYLNTISLIYANTSRQKMADVLVAAHNLIVKEGINDSLLVFTSGFVSYSKNLDPDINFSIEEALAFYVKMVYMV